MRQFAELAGDVRDPYPLFAGIRAESPVLHVELGGGPGAVPARREGAADHLGGRGLPRAGA
jgi:hypothetical protein